MERILISACLLGLKCRYDGESKPCDIDKLKEKYELIPFCPEIYGGLPTPRDGAEIKGDRVMTKKGKDVTEKYLLGAEEALSICKYLNIKKALLKEKSPSCGTGFVYDGSFTKSLVPGFGITAKKLLENGIEVYGESETDSL